jgi:hypothetical protein
MSQSEFSGIFETTEGKTLQRSMRQWMRANWDEYDNSTTLAEAAAAEFDTYGNDYGPDEIPEEVFELAYEFNEKYR